MVASNQFYLAIYSLAQEEQNFKVRQVHHRLDQSRQLDHLALVWDELASTITITATATAEAI